MAGKTGTPLLEMRKIAMHFGAVKALDRVDLELHEGEVLGLMGDNGAGKSTMIKIIAGNLTPTSGEMLVEGRSKIFSGPSDARGSGIEVVYQNLALCNNMTSAENVFLGRKIVRRLGAFPIAVNYRAMRERSAKLFQELESDTRAGQVVRSMSGGQRQAVAIARTRLNDSKAVLMDEATAAISVRQIEQVLKLINRLRDQGVSVVLVSHRMPDVFAVADRIAVLRRGEKVADRHVADTSPEEITGLITGAIERA